MKWALTISCMLGLLTIVRCGGVNSVYYDDKSCVSGTVISSSGSQIYAAGCSVIGCHAPKGGISIAGKNAQDITNALQSIGAMRSLQCLTPGEIQKLGDYFSSLTAKDEFEAEN